MRDAFGHHAVAISVALASIVWAAFRPKAAGTAPKSTSATDLTWFVPVMIWGVGAIDVFIGTWQSDWAGSRFPIDFALTNAGSSFVGGLVVLVLCLAARALASRGHAPVKSAWSIPLPALAPYVSLAIVWYTLLYAAARQAP